jgi:hypothetical protein
MRFCRAEPVRMTMLVARAGLSVGGMRVAVLVLATGVPRLRPPFHLLAPSRRVGVILLLVMSSDLAVLGHRGRSAGLGVPLRTAASVVMVALRAE